MMSFLNFKNKNSTDSKNDRVEPSLKSRRTVDSEDDSESLIENPEVQRARHRLLGAGFLLFVAIVGLPRIFDSEPKKVKNDVVLQVVTSVTDAANSKPELKDANEIKNSTLVVEEASKETVISQTKNDPNETGAKKAPPEVVEEVISESKSKDAEKPKKFYIQVATFSSSDRVKKMSGKLKDLKITTYVIERKKESDASTLYLLRAGPYPSKEEAQAAIKKMEDLEVTPKIIEMKTNP
jgi:DedD protein